MIDQEALFRFRYAAEKLSEHFAQLAKTIIEARAAELERLREARRVANQFRAQRAADTEKAYQEWKAKLEASDDR